MTQRALPVAAQDSRGINWAAISDGASFALDSFGGSATRDHANFISQRGDAGAIAGDWKKTGVDMLKAMLKYEKNHGVYVVRSRNPK